MVLRGGGGVSARQGGGTDKYTNPFSATNRRTTSSSNTYHAGDLLESAVTVTFQARQTWHFVSALYGSVTSSLTLQRMRELVQNCHCSILKIAGGFGCFYVKRILTNFKVLSPTTSLVPNGRNQPFLAPHDSLATVEK